MKNKIVCTWLLFISCICCLSFTRVKAADDEGFTVLSEVTKYYKTIRYESPISRSANNTISKTYEISKEEYDAVDTGIETQDGYTVESEYKMMTTTINSNGSYYRYKNILNWKKMPSTRSYDIIGIGFFKNVKVRGSLYFEQYSCVSGGGCTTTRSHTDQIFTTGAGTTFSLPTGNLTNLRQTFYFDVEKNTNLTLVSQEAYGDYSHATSSISYANAKRYIVNEAGITLDHDILSYYDEIERTVVEWKGRW